MTFVQAGTKVINYYTYASESLGTRLYVPTLPLRTLLSSVNLFTHMGNILQPIGMYSMCSSHNVLAHVGRTAELRLCYQRLQEKVCAKALHKSDNRREQYI